jgi:hypothetical protein
MLTKPIIIALAALCVLAAGRPAAALTAVGDAPGSIFVTGQAPQFTLTADPPADVTFTVTSYWEQVMQTGEGKAAPEGVRLSLQSLPPGFYTLDLKSGDQSASAPFGVVIDRHDAPLDPDGRVCVDSAAAWLSGPTQWEPLAKMVRLAGISWVRERLSWGDVEPTKGDYNWGKYDTVADAYKAAGVHVYQIAHDSPVWAREKRPGSLNVADLRDAYSFTKTAAAHFAGRIEAWEVWNEPDIGFWPDLSDRFAGIQKSFYLGLKTGNPKLNVLEASFCSGYRRFDESLYEQGITGYFDIFNWHIYNTPESYKGVLDGYLKLLDHYEAERRPIWLSEAGIALRGTEGKDKALLAMRDQHLQCRFLTPSVLMSLAAGTDRHFFFVLPHYLENGVQFGLLNPDLTPHPGFLALSACANIIGHGEYLGRYAADPSVEARMFAGPGGDVLVLWAQQPTAVTIPCRKPSVTVADVFGYGEPTQPVDGKLTIKVGPEATYVIGADDAVRSKLEGPKRGRGVLPANKPSKVILVGHSDLPTDKGKDVYVMRANETFTYSVDVYNFNETGGSRGRVELHAPAGWQATPDGVSVDLAPMDRQQLVFHVRAVSPRPGMQKLVSTGSFGGHGTASAVSTFVVDPASLTPIAEQPLDLSPDVWTTSVSGNGKAEHRQGEGGAFVLIGRFDKPGDRWCYATQSFAVPRDFRNFSGVSFEVRSSADDLNSRVRFMVAEPNGARYFTEAGAPASKQWQKLVFTFSDMVWGAFSSPDPKGKLDLDKISHIEVGFNTPLDDMTLEVRDLKLVKLQ